MKGPAMRGEADPRPSVFSYVDIEQQILPVQYQYRASRTPSCSMSFTASIDDSSAYGLGSIRGASTIAGFLLWVNESGV